MRTYRIRLTSGGSLICVCGLTAIIRPVAVKMSLVRVQSSSSALLAASYYSHRTKSFLTHELSFLFNLYPNLYPQTISISKAYAQTTLGALRKLSASLALSLCPFKAPPSTSPSESPSLKAILLGLPSCKSCLPRRWSFPLMNMYDQTVQSKAK